MPVEMITGRIEAAIIGMPELPRDPGVRKGQTDGKTRDRSASFVKVSMKGHASAQVRSEIKSTKTEKNGSGALILLRLNT